MLIVKGTLVTDNSLISFSNLFYIYVIYYVKKKNRRSTEKVAIDGVFFGRMKDILRIIVPGIFSKEAGFMMLVAAALISRSICDIWLIQNGTSIER